MYAGTLYTNTINGQDTGNIEITPVGGNTIITNLYATNTLSAFGGMEMSDSDITDVGIV